MTKTVGRTGGRSVFAFLRTDIDSLVPKTVPNPFTIIFHIEHGNPFDPLKEVGGREKSNGSEGRGCDKKRMVACNGRHRCHAPTRKGADVSLTRNG